MLKWKIAGLGNILDYSSRDPRNILGLRKEKREKRKEKKKDRHKEKKLERITFSILRTLSNDF